jgi:hypothetical protein
MEISEERKVGESIFERSLAQLSSVYVLKSSERTF